MCWLLSSLSLSAGMALFGCLGGLLPGLWQQGKQSTCCVHRGAVWVRLLELNRTITTSIPLSSWRHWALYTTRTFLDHVGSWKHMFCCCHMFILCRAGSHNLVLFSYSNEPIAYYYTSTENSMPVFDDWENFFFFLRKCVYIYMSWQINKPIAVFAFVYKVAYCHVSN